MLFRSRYLLIFFGQQKCLARLQLQRQQQKYVRSRTIANVSSFLTKEEILGQIHNYRLLLACVCSTILEGTEPLKPTKAQMYAAADEGLTALKWQGLLSMAALQSQSLSNSVCNYKFVEVIKSITNLFHIFNQYRLVFQKDRHSLLAIVL